jgi:hypothetical protein
MATEMARDDINTYYKALDMYVSGMMRMMMMRMMMMMMMRMMMMMIDD